jgi:hypothetical protein
MATVKRSKKVSNPATGRKKPSARKGKKNPQTTGKKHKHRRASNPNIGSWRDILVGIGVALGTAVAARNVPQMLLAEKNEGIPGYAANAGITAVCAVAADHFLGRSAGFAAGIGGGVIVLDRVLTEKVSPIGRYLSLKGIGDASSVAGLKGIRNGIYLTKDEQGNWVIPQQYTDAAVAEMERRQPVAALPAMAGTGRRGDRRMNLGRAA